MSSSVKNPCISVCKYNAEDICIGCYRKKSESVGWPEFSDKKKKEILEDTEKRRFGNNQGGIEYPHDLYV